MNKKKGKKEKENQKHFHLQQAPRCHYSCSANCCQDSAIWFVSGSAQRERKHFFLDYNKHVNTGGFSFLCGKIQHGVFTSDRLTLQVRKKQIYYLFVC